MDPYTHIWSCPTFRKLGLMTDVDVQGTSKDMICKVGPRGHGQRDMQVDLF